VEEITEEKHEKPSTSQSFWEIVHFAVLALIIVIPLRVFVAEPFIVSGSSMVPTLENGNYLIIDKISYRVAEPKRYDIVVFHYPKDIKKFFIKRIVGLPNEVVDINGNIVTITNDEYKDGLKLEEPYVRNVANNNTHFELGEDEYFVMGDNRSASSDSRYWGAVKKKLVVGKPIIRLMPLSQIGILPRNYASK
jgi:signal peptidase I